MVVSVELTIQLWATIHFSSWNLFVAPKKYSLYCFASHYSQSLSLRQKWRQSQLQWMYHYQFPCGEGSSPCWEPCRLVDGGTKSTWGLTKPPRQHPQWSKYWDSGPPETWMRWCMRVRLKRMWQILLKRCPHTWRLLPRPNKSRTVEE